ncbi:multidrug resistance efflux transporter family protein [Pseudoflavonifractor phocaeensis]|uniref:multidrug resistance efflux transporter family protein n=1 Tax=Pseudoflavonifractor phocaeensis TaxID=1870988 RepID=UPI0012BD67A6|nr:MULTISPECIES: multidrug resistance efflux transporter family protein [Pseudoflavonifractor]MTQ95991.1 multidrug resistance efflux transporter family protein [Pseudoflavonifractor sp. BIOML-A16]MTR04743.1 multidrug resistance efflux transporter family protein [Pseudoflavonifractor sp. BIOML-A15]MTR31009.1 multidrug resistance efflux transporter family protein [Pseudoflavonifractor sp. BIOML-A14]MTR71574.1 multidrug resistance efflux transporter family protein [Pseudoflavonifractor sp. BIOML-A
MVKSAVQSDTRTGQKAVALGLLASVFFSFTYVLNNLMALEGGSWLWTASLRFFLSLPILFVMVLLRGTMGRTMAVIRKAPGKWLLWSTVAFGIFYAPFAFAAAYGPSWLVSGTYQFTMFAGALLTPLFWTVRQTPDGPVRERGKIPVRLFPAFAVILVGVFLLQVEHAQQTSFLSLLLFSLPVLLSAFAYPLGNRKMMELVGDELGVIERVFGMNLCVMPFCIVLAIFGGISAGAPSSGQMLQSLAAAFFPGICATLLFFHGTQLVRGDPHWLALVESTQCGEILLCLAGGVFLLGNPMPGAMGAVGLALIVVGMVVNSVLQSRTGR